MRSLLVLELRRLLPWLVVWGLTCGLTCLDDILRGPPDQRASWVADTVYSLQLEFGGEVMIFAFLLCYGGFPREQEDGTLDLLLALPVARWKILVSKAVAVGGALAAGVALVLGWKALYAVPNVSSFDGGLFRWDWAVQSLLLALAVIASSVGYSLLLTVFRQLSLVVLAVFFLAMTIYRAESGEMLRVLPSDILESNFYGSRWLVPWQSLGAHLAVASLSLSMAGWFWLGKGRQWIAAVGYYAPIARPLGKLVAMASAGISLLALLVVVVSDRLLPGAGWSDKARGPVDSVLTSAYEFRYRREFAATVETLANVSDVDYSKVAGRFGLEPADRRIVVDTTRWSRAAHGSAAHDSIRLRVFESSTVRQLRSTLAHETAHVLANRVSHGQTSKRNGAYLFFDEGLATQIALSIVPDHADREQNYFEAMALQARHGLSARAVVESGATQRRFGVAVRYPLGLTWVEALQGVCGEEAPRHLLHTMGMDDLPLDLKAQALWQQTMSRIGCDWVTVAARWQTDLAQYRARWADELQQLPKLVGGRCVQQPEGAMLTAVVEGEMPPGGRVHLSLRTSFTGGLLDGTTVLGDVAPDGTVSFQIAQRFIVKGRVNYQLSLHWPRSGTDIVLPNEYQQAFVLASPD